MWYGRKLEESDLSGGDKDLEVQIEIGVNPRHLALQSQGSVLPQLVCSELQ